MQQENEKAYFPKCQVIDLMVLASSFFTNSVKQNPFLPVTTHYTIF